jgi:hypothetical protein
MNFKIFPSFRGDGTLVQLNDFLCLVKDNEWVWSVMDFDGVGVPPNNLHMNDFENLARLNPEGFVMTWHDLRSFAGTLVQTYDCLVVGAKSIKDISGDKSEKDTFSRCEVVIEAFDSTEWAVWARDPDLMNTLSRLPDQSGFNAELQQVVRGRSRSLP